MDEKRIWLLTEREKEIECMYAVDDVLQNKKLSLAAAMNRIVQILPSGFADTDACRIQIKLYDAHFSLPEFDQAAYLHKTSIFMDDKVVGSLEARYLISPEKSVPELLPTEIKIMDAVAARISQLALSSKREMNLILDMLQKVNPDILDNVCQRLQVYLSEIEEEAPPMAVPTYGEVNTPLPKLEVPDALEFGQKLVSRAAAFLSSAEMLTLINQWIQDERLFSLVKIIGRRESEVSEILDAIQNYKQQMNDKKIDTKQSDAPMEKWVVAELAHRFLTNDENLIDRVLDNLAIEDFELLLLKMVGSSKTSGGIGGKGAGLFIAEQILKRASQNDPLLADIKTPRTWYLAADQMEEFLQFNHMEDLNAYKYNTVSYIRLTYDDIVSKIKNARLPSHIMRTLNMVLDDLPGVPIIVRSSSLLEDRSQSAFSGKYKSLYLANQGTKEKRLDALVDGILEVYSSQYNPDSFQYRQNRGLLHFAERMGVLIREVVGTRIGPYYMPLFAGVGFSENPHSWSPRITREGGLVRMVMGLGTRAVDRVNNDYPLLFSPANPGFRINQNPEDIRHYSPKYIDLMNLENGTFETVAAEEFLKTWGNKVPKLHKLVSVYQDGFIQKKNKLELSPQKDQMIITFDGIIYDTDFANKMSRIFNVLKGKMGVQVDLEFAYDGEHLILLQCRTLNRGSFNEGAEIPKNIPKKDIIFTANRFVPNGKLQNIRYLVYVDGDEYSRLPNKEDLLAVGEAVGKLNGCLPYKKYILMGPGRWGSRGDIQLGVRVTYADICNTAILIEVAKRKQSYVPEVSFGTHFFQDLVESNIAYIPLYPDEENNIFNDEFIKYQPNHLDEFLPQYKGLSKVLRVIDLAESDGKKILSVHMNAKLNQAVAFLADSVGGSGSINSRDLEEKVVSVDSPADQIGWQETGVEQHWRWRKYMADQIAKELDFTAYGVKGIYLFGSTDEETAGICSDIDLLVHDNGNEKQRQLLSQWLEGFSLALAKINYLRTGTACKGGLLDVHFITDDDISRKDSFAIKINSVIYPATPLRVEVKPNSET